MPLYLKSHSYGEYVFDHAWADAWARAGGQYYPKAQIGIPFTPVPGRRLLVDPDLDETTKIRAETALAEVALDSANQLGLSSVHMTFLTKDEHDHLTTPEHSAWISREGMQFHWHNHGYGDFDDFLSTLSSRKRKAIKRERRDISDAGLTFDLLRGEDLKTHHWDAFYHFYLATIDRKWGGAYLTRGFFDHIHQTMRDISCSSSQNMMASLWQGQLILLARIRFMVATGVVLLIFRSCILRPVIIRPFPMQLPMV